MKYAHIKGTGEKYAIGKIVCVGRNYAEHARELGNEIPEFPVLFLKPPSALIYSGENIIKPSFSDDMHHEIEVVLLIGSDLSNAGEEESRKAIKAFGIGLDMTLRDIQNSLKKKGEPWTVSKCFDTSAAISEFILTDQTELSEKFVLSLSVNGQLRQSSTLDKMIFSPVQIVSFISSRMKLEAGDLIFTGTPAGVGKVVPGDSLSGSLDNLLTITAGVI